MVPTRKRNKWREVLYWTPHIKHMVTVRWRVVLCW